MIHDLQATRRGTVRRTLIKAKCNPVARGVLNDGQDRVGEVEVLWLDPAASRMRTA